MFLTMRMYLRKREIKRGNTEFRGLHLYNIFKVPMLFPIICRRYEQGLYMHVLMKFYYIHSFMYLFFLFQKYRSICPFLFPKQ